MNERWCVNVEKPCDSQKEFDDSKNSLNDQKLLSRNVYWSFGKRGNKILLILGEKRIFLWFL